MSMASFINDNLELILEDWEHFAGTLHPAAEGLSRDELRDFARAVLLSVAEDMKTQQSEKQRHRKSVGDLNENASALGEKAREHAAERLTEGFTLNQLIAEYRAVRASVVRLWKAHLDQSGEDATEELTRFNEAIDESLSEAVGWYNSRIEEARDLLNGVLAHDMRNPLGSITTSVEALLHDDSLSPPSTRAAVIIRNGGRRMEKMIDDLLDFTRTRLGTGLPIETSDGDLKQVLSGVVDELRGYHPGATVDCQIHGDLTGTWDLSRIEQLLSNLISNAIEHGRPGLPVTVSARGLNGDVVVAVHNGRNGIPEADQRVIFDPLRRAMARSEAPEPSRRGLGLGLYIARQIAEAHDGAIDVESSEQQGTTFTVRLPRHRKSRSETAGMT